jgi:hypothetical protein
VQYNIFFHQPLLKPWRGMKVCILKLKVESSGYKIWLKRIFPEACTVSPVPEAVLKLNKLAKKNQNIA